MYNTIIVFGASAERGSDGKWCSSERDANGITHGRWRIKAAKYLFEEMRCQIIVTAGTLYPPGESEPVRVGAVMKAELVELGVPEHFIKDENDSGSTYENLLSCTPLIQQRRGKVKLLSCEWHLERIQTLLHASQLPHYKDLKQIDSWYDNYELVAAEQVLVRAEPEYWLKKISESRVSEDTRRRIEHEKKAIRQILEGKYSL